MWRLHVETKLWSSTNLWVPSVGFSIGSWTGQDVKARRSDFAKTCDMEMIRHCKEISWYFIGLHCLHMFTSYKTGGFQTHLASLSSFIFSNLKSKKRWGQPKKTEKTKTLLQFQLQSLRNPGPSHRFSIEKHIALGWDQSLIIIRMSSIISAPSSGCGSFSKPRTWMIWMTQQNASYLPFWAVRCWMMLMLASVFVLWFLMLIWSLDVQMVLFFGRPQKAAPRSFESDVPAPAELEWSFPASSPWDGSKGPDWHNRWICTAKTNRSFE